MAVTTTYSRNKAGREQYVIAMTELNDNTDISFIGTPEKISVQCEGISASDVNVQASIDGTNYYALPTAVSFGEDGIKVVADADLGFPKYRVRLDTANEGGNAVTAYVHAVVREYNGR